VYVVHICTYVLCAGKIKLAKSINIIFFLTKSFQDRFWRKNRHRYAGHSCSGVDINRNFGNHWNYQGASQNVSHLLTPPVTFAIDPRL